jgi:zinc protease
VGSRDEPAGKNGLAGMASLLSLVARPGGPQTPTLNQQSLDLKANTRALATQDLTHFITQLPKKNLEKLLALEAQRLRDPLAHLTEADFLLQRNTVIDDLRKIQDTTAGGLQASWISAQLLRGPYAHPPYGEPASIQGLSLEDVRAFVKEHYSPVHAVLTVSGPIPSAEVIAQVERAFSERAAPPGLPPASVARPAAPPFPELLPGQEEPPVQSRPVEHPTLLLLWTAPSSYTKGNYEAAWLSPSLEFALKERSRDGRVLKTAVHTVTLEGVTLIIAEVSLKKADAAKTVALALLGPSGTQRLTEAMQDRVKYLPWWRDGQFLYLMDLVKDTSVLVETVATFTQATGQADYIGWEKQVSESITEDSLSDYIGRYITRERVRMLLLTPE